MFRGDICEKRRDCVIRNEIKRIEKLLAREFGKLTIQGLVSRKK
jgi:hypothetical protein